MAGMVRSALLDSRRLNLSRIDVYVEQGVCYLSGEASSGESKLEAEALAGRIPGWMGSALFSQYHLAGPWSIAVRPEVFRDRNGRMTQFQQMIWANTPTLSTSGMWACTKPLSVWSTAMTDRPERKGGFYQRAGCERAAAVDGGAAGGVAFGDLGLRLRAGC